MELSLLTLGFIGIAIFMILLFLGMNVGLCMLVSGFFGIMLVRGSTAALSSMGFIVNKTSSAEFLVVLPMFILMGMAAVHAGVSKDTFQTLHKWVGHLPGGLAMAAICACTLFGSVCGNVVATAATLGKVALPEMRKYQYSVELSAGTVATGGNLGALVPPSTALIVFGFVTQTSIGALFMAGIIPAILLTVLFMIQIYIQCKINPKIAPLSACATWKERLIATRGLISIVVVFVIAMGGIIAGFFTPVEAGAAGSAAMFLVGVITQRLTWKGTVSALREAGQITAMIMLLIFGAMVFSSFLTTTEITQSFSQLFLESDLNRFVVMLIVLFFYFALGTFMDSWALLIISLPIFFPIVSGLGFDPVHFGVLCAVTVMIGNITPPVGVTVFAIRGVAPDIPVGTIFKGCTPFLITTTLFMIFLVFVPAVSVALPDLLIPYR